jgi:hypothetical protein
MLRQRRDTFQRETVAGELPVGLELATMENRPLADETERAVR